MNSIVEYIHQHALERPETLCLIDDSRSVTYREYWSLIKKTASILRQHGVTSGTRVVIESTQDIQYLAAEMALHLLHAVFVPMERNCSVYNLCQTAQKVDAVFIITNASIPDYRVFSYNQLETELESSDCYEDYTFPNADTVSEILFSTGTTGKPKGIVLTHRSAVALAENVQEGLEMEADNMELIPVPLNHSHGLRRYYGNMFNGSSVIIMNGVLNINRFFSYLDHYPVTAIDLVPSSLAIIFKLSKEKLADYRSQLRYIQLGTAPLPEEHKEALCRLLPYTRLYNFYGSTESGCTCILNFNDGIRRPHCIGKPTVNAHFITVDESRNEVQATPTTPALLATSGPMNMKEYFDDPIGTKKVLGDGYVYTNDLAYIQDGYIYLVGRQGDVINVGGNKVSPQEIEEIALKYPGIKDCACVASPDPLKGSVPKLFVVTDTEDFSVKALGQFLALHLEPYKVPKKIQLIDEIPKTFNGKIKRKELQSL